MKSLLEKIEYFINEKNAQDLKDIYNYYKNMQGPFYNKLKFISNDSFTFQVFEGNNLNITNKDTKKIVDSLTIVFSDLGYKKWRETKGICGRSDYFY